MAKIHDENWVKLLADFTDYGFAYEKMLKNFSNANDYRSALLLAETILSSAENGGRLEDEAE